MSHPRLRAWRLLPTVLLWMCASCAARLAGREAHEPLAGTAPAPAAAHLPPGSPLERERIDRQPGGSAADPAAVATEAGAGAFEGEESVVEEARGIPVHGSLSMRYRYRGNSDARDNDLYATLALDVADPELDAVTAHVLVDAALDLDGQSSDPGQRSVYSSIEDTWDGSLVSHLYHAYLDVHAVEGLERARLGRQLDYDTPVLAWFDGAALETEEISDLRAQVGAYGGLPVRIYESSPEGFLGGAYVQARPWRAGRVRFDYMHMQDEDAQQAERQEDLYGVRAWQGIGREASVSAGYTRLGSENRDWFGRADWFDADTDLRLSADYYELLEPQGNLPIEINPFYDSLFELEPYRRTLLLASKGLGRHFRLEGGAAFRRLAGSAQEGPTNRDFDRYHLTASLLELPAELDLNLTGELYDASGQEISSWGADLSRDFGDAWSAGLGSYYALFEFDPALQQERERVRTYYLRTRHRRSSALAFELRLEYQDSEDFEDYVLRLGSTWNF